MLKVSKFNILAQSASVKEQQRSSTGEPACPGPEAHEQTEATEVTYNSAAVCFRGRVSLTCEHPSLGKLDGTRVTLRSSPPFDFTSSVMSSDTTHIEKSRPVTPPLPSPRSPRSPLSPGALQPPACRHRDRSPSPMRGYLIPSPLPTRRNRTCSATVRASEGPEFSGVCKYFSRSKGHGFITPADGGSDIFVHISDIEGEYVPVEGDEMSYKICSIPPKHEKVQAVEVTITHLKPGTVHETWSGHVVSS
ncbi:hypothetical protein Q5P01_016764 [Channa striata]|uniref:CSD domain-containing protein n=1 Tax=Channa striata TaxID=64152 RepID=A0AA88M877_CHASR|nr:hypothetical protein Q5P01_016764 [Channa striata]